MNIIATKTAPSALITLGDLAGHRLYSDPGFMSEIDPQEATRDALPDPITQEVLMAVQKQLLRQDEFNSVMTWLGKMISACNEMEMTLQMFLVNLLRCEKRKSAIIVSQERRPFPALVDLIEKLFAVYVHEKSARDELKTAGKDAKELYEKRNTHVHSLWFQQWGETNPPATRFKNNKDAGPVDVEVSELATLAYDLDNCRQRISDLMDRYLATDTLQSGQ
jgi:hypothetical protein